MKKRRGKHAFGRVEKARLQDEISVLRGKLKKSSRDIKEERGRMISALKGQKVLQEAESQAGGRVALMCSAFMQSPCVPVVRTPWLRGLS